MECCVIKSKENSLFKKIKKLKEKKYRDKESLFLAEGRKFLDFKEKPLYAIINESFEIELGDIETYILSDSLFKSISSQENSQGVIFVYKIKTNDIENISNNIVVLDKIQDPGNMGTIIRTCDAAGFNDIILTKGCVDIYNEKTVRSSMGSIFSVNFYILNEHDCIDFLKDNFYEILSTGLTEKAINYNEIILKNKNAFVFGNEGNGVSFDILNVSDQIVKIPIFGSAESLNVGVALGIFLYKVKEFL